MTRTGEEPSGAADLSPPLARAAVCLLALLAESMHSRLSIIPVVGPLLVLYCTRRYRY